MLESTAKKKHKSRKTKVKTLSELLDSLNVIKPIQLKINEGHEPSDEEQELWESEVNKVKKHLKSDKYKNPLVALTTLEISEEELGRNLDLLLRTEESIRAKLLKKSSDEYPNAVYEMMFHAEKPGKLSTKTHILISVLKALKDDIGTQALASLIEGIPIKPLPQVSAFQHAIDSGNKELVQFCLENGIGLKARFLVQRKELSLFEYLSETKNLEMAVVAVNSLSTNLSASDRIEILKLKKRMAKNPESEQLAWVFNEEVEQELLKRVQHFKTKDFLELYDEDFLYSLSWDIWQSYIQDKNTVKPNEVLTIFKKFQEVINDPTNQTLKRIFSDIATNLKDLVKLNEHFSKLEKFLKDNKKSRIYLNLKTSLYKQSILFLASFFRRSEDIEALIKAGSNPNQADINGVTPLYIACQSWRIDLVKVLLASHKVDLNQALNDGVTPLFAACQIGHGDVVKELLASNQVNPNQAENDGVTPLYIACQHRHIDAVRGLLASDKVDPNQPNKNGATPLFIACEKGNIDVVKELLASDKVDPNQADLNGVTPLYIACQNGHIDVVKELLASDKVDPNQPNKNGFNPLHISCQIGHQDIIDLLLENKKVNFRAQYTNGSEALQFAAQSGNVGVINGLLAKRIFDVHYINKENSNALYYACSSGNIDAVRIFTKLGLNPTLLNDKGENIITAMLDLKIQNPESDEEKTRLKAVKKEIEAYIARYNEVKSKLTTDYARHLPEEMQQNLMSMQSSSSTSLSSSSQAQEDALAREKILETATTHVLKELSKTKKSALKVCCTPQK